MSLYWEINLNDMDSHCIYRSYSRQKFITIKDNNPPPPPRARTLTIADLSLILWPSAYEPKYNIRYIATSRIPFWMVEFHFLNLINLINPQMIMIMTITSFKSSFCIEYFYLIHLIQMWMVCLNIIQDIFSTFPLKSSFSLLKERQELKTSNSVNVVTVIRKKPLNRRSTKSRNLNLFLHLIIYVM